jgi:4-amino-4-deoxy-L-arabinose transferase-like glycosyltransferase
MAIDTPTLSLDRAATGARNGRLGPAGEEGGAATRLGRVSRTKSELAGLVTLLVATAVAYTWNLSASGNANSFYAAAVQAGTRSWKAFFFGSLDSSNFITVDKPPASLWVMELFGRVFGFSSVSMLVPQALEGVATVAVLYAIIRRWFGHRAGLVAGLVMATTPVAALMFRFNNPDALLVLLMTLGAYCTARALEKAGTRWLMLAGAAIGFGFLAKMGQALLVVPGFGLAYLVAAPTSWLRRVAQLAAALGALILAAGWWVLAVTLWPAGSRPMIDGSPTNSIWNLIVGYNGFERVVSTSGAGGGGGASFSGATGVFRLFNSLMGGQASWLIPAAAVILIGGLWVSRPAPRTDRLRASLIMWGAWLVITGAVFSFGQGVIHTYYTVALGPAVAALTAIGVSVLARRWNEPWTRFSASALLALTTGWAVVLLGRSPHWNPWLRPLIIVAAAVAVTGLIAALAMRSTAMRRTVGGIAVAAAIVAALAGPASYTVKTIAAPETGSIPSAGPAIAASSFGGGGVRGGAGGGSNLPPRSGPVGTGLSGGSGAGTGGGPQAPGASASRPGGIATGGNPVAGQVAGAGSPTSQVSAGLVSALKANASRYRWVAATDGSQSAASIELASGGQPVMAIGGFNSQGGNLSLTQFEKYVEAGQIHYFIASGSGGGPGGGGGSTATSITSWVEAHFTAKSLGGVTVYDLTAPKS